MAEKMRLKSCKRCGRPFETDAPGAYLCPDCAAESKRNSSIRERVCIDCGVTFLGGPRAMRCLACRAQRNKERDRIHKKIGTARKIGSIDCCERCGAEYVVNSGRQRYCKNCAAEAVAETVRRHKREYMEEYSKAHVAEKEANRSFNKICVICGKIFDDSTPTVTCSEECADALRKKRMREADFRRGRRKTPPDVKYDSGKPKSGIVGVTYLRGKWQATCNGVYVGIFPDIPSAAAALEDFKSGNFYKNKSKK